MNQPIYLLISIVIGASIILILTRTTVFINDANQESLVEEKVFENFVTTQQILEYYLRKIGYKSSVNSIIEADSSKIIFLCDDDGDGFTDTLEIKSGISADISSNPNDFKIILIKNNVEQIIAPYGVTKFKLEYLDINGNPTNENLFIRFIIINLRVESEVPYRDRYFYFEDKIVIRPKNLG